MEELIHALVCKTIPYGEGALIATLFTQEKGLLKAFVKRQQLKQAKSATLMPLSFIEAIVWRGQGSLWRLKELSISSAFLELRQESSRLQSAGRMVHWLLETQRELQESPLLYGLLLDYWQRLSRGIAPEKLLGSFLLKLVRLEGMWRDDFCCEVCQKSLWPLYLTSSALVCEAHRLDEEGLPISELDWRQLQLLAYCRDEQQLELIDMGGEGAPLLQLIERLALMRL